ncbi:MAG: hypothetical protein KY458_12735 [Actinobacteria bacterium]|nr:hypothetical protein [Actinomycetota bacterium]
MERIGKTEDGVMAKVVGKGSRKGSTFFGRAGGLIQRPPASAAIAAILSATGDRP